MPPDLPKSLSFRRSFRKMVSIYPFLDPIVYSCFIQPTMFFTIAVSNKSVMKSGRLKYSDISIKWDCKLLLPLQFKSNLIYKI